MCLPPLRGRITHLGGGKPRRRTHLPRMQHQGGVQCNGSPTGGGALSKPQTAPPLNTTIDICTGAHLKHQLETRSTLFYLLYNVQCAVFKEHSNAQLHCALNSAVHSAEQGDGGVQCEAPVAGYHSHLSEGLR